MEKLTTNLSEFPKIEIEIEEIYVKKNTTKEIESIEDLFSDETFETLIEEGGDNLLKMFQNTL